MAQPTPYDRQFSFQDFQAQEPTTPLPGDEVDGELNSVKVTLDQTLVNLAKIQRDDGALKNGVVTQDSLSDSLSIGFTYRGTWVSGVNYLISDGASVGSTFYKAKSSHLSSGANQPPNATFWDPIADFTPLAIGVDSIFTAAIQDGAVTEPKHATGGVSTRALADSGVTEPKHATGGVSTRALADSGVTEPKHATGGVSTRALANNAVTFAKTQDIATARLLGRTTASTGDIEELTADAAEGLLGAATARLFPAGSASAPGISPVGDSSTGMWAPAADTIAFSAGAAEKTRVDSSGVKIGTTALLDAGGVLQVSGLTTLYNTTGLTPLFITNPGSGSQTLVAFRQGGPASTVGSIVVSGGTGTAYNTSSDYRLKENVAALDLAEAKETVAALTPRRFNFIADPGTVVDGFLAHEVNEAAPNAHAVTGEKDGEEMQGIDPSKLIATLTAALQWAIREIEYLKAR